MNDLAVSCICEHLYRVLTEPEQNLKVEDFEERTYQRWAALELLQTILDKPFQPAEDTIEEFILRTGWYSLTSEKTRASYIFEIANETSKELLSLYLESI